MQPHRGITDWQAMLALWKHVLFQLLGLRRSSNSSITLLALPAPLSRADHAYVTQLFFEQLNCPGLALLETPLLSAYAAGTLSAAVVDIGWSGSSVSPVLDCAVAHNALVRCPVGARECTLWLAHLLRQDASIVQALGALDDVSVAAAASAATETGSSSSSSSSAEDRRQAALIELAELLLHEGHLHGLNEDEAGSAVPGASGAMGGGEDDEQEFDVAAMLVKGNEKEMIEEQERRKQALQSAQSGSTSHADAAAAITGQDGQAGGSTDARATLVTFRGLTLKVGPSRFRWAEPLFKPSLLSSVPGAQPSTISAPPFGAGTEPSDAVLGSVVRTGKAATAPVDWETAPSLPQCIAAAIGQVGEADRRPQLWDSLVITGAPTRLRGLSSAILRHSANYVGTNAPETGMGVPDEPNPLQARSVRALKVPDYFANFKERTDLAPFLGATIYAKVSRSCSVARGFQRLRARMLTAALFAISSQIVFTDPTARSYVTKSNYNESGPAVSFAITA